MKFAIYGFFFSKNFLTNRASFSVLTENDVRFWNRVKKSRDRKLYNLTGYLESNETDLEEFVFTMEAVLSFVQQQDVRLVEVTSEEIEPYYESSFDRHSSGAPFAIYQDIQEEIVDKLYEKLLDYNNLCNLKTEKSPFDNEHNFEFKSLVYKTLEPMKMRRYLVEVPFYLYFSGLEAFCKQYLKSYYKEIKIEKDASKNIARMLEKLEINYIQVDTDDTKFNLRKKINKEEDFLKLSLSTYSNLRNSLFHQNLFVADCPSSYVKNNKGNYPKQQVKITDFDYYLHRLCNAVILKYIGIENKKLDCSKWYTRVPMIK